MFLRRRRLEGATYVTFSVEKAATGLLRLVSRLFSRPGVAINLARALPWLIPPLARPVVFASLAGHVSSAMRRLVRAAVGEGAQAVGRAEWGAVLSVLEACARMGGRGEVDTFEAVCLLVHNKDLKVGHKKDLKVYRVHVLRRCLEISSSRRAYRLTFD